MQLTVRSQAFESGDPIPVRFTGDGTDVSPPLTWEGVPKGAREFALICDDPDAPTPEPWVHWVIYQIGADVRALPEGIPAASHVGTPVTALQGKNSWSAGQMIGYRGPAPPPGHGVHHYHFQVFALDAELGLEPDRTKQELLDAMQGHVLASGELVGTYSR